MIEESLLQSNFLGRDGFRWWVGQLPPAPFHNQGAEGWGNRYRVRIMGYHPFYETELANDDLPWANVLLPTTAGSGKQNNAASVALSPGDVVFGFFLDGDNAQIPVISGTFGNTSIASIAGQYKGPFIPFAGYTGDVPAPNSSPGSGTLAADESNEDGNANSQKSPVARSEKNAEKSDNVAAAAGIGDELVPANACSDTAIDNITKSVNNFIKKIEGLQDDVARARREVRRVAGNIIKDANKIVGQMTQWLSEELIGLAKEGLKFLYKSVFAKILAVSGNPVAAHLGGVAAQTAMVVPTNLLEKALTCLVGNVTNILYKTVENMLFSVVDNITNFVECVAEQFVGSILNKIVGQIASFLDGPLGAISKILSAGFNVANLLRSAVGAIAGIAALFGCNQNNDKCKGVKKTITLGKNPAVDLKNNLNNILDAGNELAASLTDFPDFGQFANPLSTCYGGNPTDCNKPLVTIFGGNGSGGAAEAIMGTIVRSATDATASVIGVRVTNPGSGYEFPPFVHIGDNCNKGYGAVGRSIINDKGEITSIYIVSDGENYPVGEEEDVAVVDTIVDFPGIGYNDDDIGVDDNGTEYAVKTDKGSIVSLKPININIIKDLPSIRIISDTGSGARIRPVLDTPEVTGDVQQVIDCIS